LVIGKQLKIQNVLDLYLTMFIPIFKLPYSYFTYIKLKYKKSKSIDIIKQEKGYT